MKRLGFLMLSVLLPTALAQTAAPPTADNILNNLFGPQQVDSAGNPLGGSQGSTQNSLASSDSAAQGTSLSRTYPITLNVAQLSRAGATPNTAYVLLRDLKSMMSVSGSQHVTLKTSGRTLSYTKYSRAATINNQPARLNATPVNIDETSLFPLAALQLLGCSYEPLEPMKQLRTYAVTCPGADDTMAVQAFILRNNNPGPTPLFPSVVKP